jgi:retinol dehydrogenase 12
VAKYDGWAAYGQSKLSNILFTSELNRRIISDPNNKVSVFSLHPGLVDTQLLVKGGFQSSSAIPVAEGAQTSTFLATAPDDQVVPKSGAYFFESKPASSSSISHSKEEGSNLWKHSLEFTKVQWNL